MNDEPFGRQPKPVHVEFKGEEIDVDYYIGIVKNIIEHRTYANVVVENNTITIYPGAVNE